MRARIKIKCDWCRKTYYKTPCYLKNKKHYFCSLKCCWRWNAQHRVGKNNKLFKQLKIKCDWCRKEFYKTVSSYRRNKHNFCSMKCRDNWSSKNIRNTRHHCWIGGCKHSDYPECFDEQLKESIRKRDKHKCMNCDTPEKECFRKLSVHHIDYNKKNCDQINLITLCISCNAKANYNRKYWQNYYENIQIERKVHLLEKEF